jgi:phosphate transport system permease protein
VFPGIGTYNAAAAGIVLGIMVLPTVASQSEDALRAVPRRLRVAALGLGATKAEVTTRIVLPAGMSGILASFILGISRALGETMAVTMAAGNSPRLTLNPLDAVQTLSAFMVQAGQGSIQNGTLEYRTLLAVGTALLGVTVVMNLVAHWVRTHFASGGERP